MVSKVLSLAWQDLMYTLRVGLHSTVAKNAASLYIIQSANYLLPLITVPYLVRALGPSEYGLVAFGQGLIAYFTIFSDYGFALSATRKISLERGDPRSVSRTATNVWASKALLAVAGFILLLTAIISIPKLHETSILFIILYGIVIGNVLFPTWLFQGMEKMLAISVINLVMQFLIMIGIFTLVHNPEDYIIYAGLISSGSILSGLVGLILALSMFKVQPVIPSINDILETLKDGWMLFLSVASLSLYSAGNALILGLLTNTTVVGYYIVAERIVKAIIVLTRPISSAAYPKFSKLSIDSRALAVKWGQRLTFFLGSIGLIISIAVILGAPTIIRIFLGSEFGPSIMVMRILAIWIFIDAVTSTWGIQIMLTFKYDRAFFAISLVAGAINIILALLFVPTWKEIGMALSVILACVFVAIAQITILWTKGFNVLMGQYREN
ncbi:Polysaccharide biosynthesis protein [uncultured archaeon]|nr:Polysaccharide biosynthesis protein [uncultured archaeon]